MYFYIIYIYIYTYIYTIKQSLNQANQTNKQAIKQSIKGATTQSRNSDTGFRQGLDAMPVSLKKLKQKLRDA